MIVGTIPGEKMMAPMRTLFASADASVYTMVARHSPGLMGKHLSGCSRAAACRNQRLILKFSVIADVSSQYCLAIKAPRAPRKALPGDARV